MPDAGRARLWLRRLPGYRAMRVLLDLARGSEQRAAALLRWRAQAGLFQPFGTTSENRYPRVFAALRTALGADVPVRLLSFGCSTGEEVRTLRRYFPHARITGLDISPERIAACRARTAGSDAELTMFAVVDSARDEPDALYDAVLAMAVFRHARLDDARRNDLIAFDRFEREIAELARVLRPGGYLAIRNANFRFCDTASAAGFDSVLTLPGTAPLFGPDGARLPEQALEQALFRKRQASLPPVSAPR